MMFCLKAVTAALSATLLLSAGVAVAGAEPTFTVVPTIADGSTVRGDKTMGFLVTIDNTGTESVSVEIIPDWDNITRVRDVAAGASSTLNLGYTFAPYLDAGDSIAYLGITAKSGAWKESRSFSYFVAAAPAIAMRVKLGEWDKPIVGEAVNVVVTLMNRGNITLSNLRVNHSVAPDASQSTALFNPGQGKIFNLRVVVTDAMLDGDTFVDLVTVTSDEYTSAMEFRIGAEGGDKTVLADKAEPEPTSEAATMPAMALVEETVADDAALGSKRFSATVTIISFAAIIGVLLIAVIVARGAKRGM